MIALHREIEFRSPAENRFRIGAIDVSIVGDLPDALDDFTALYEHARQPVSEPAAADASLIHMEIRSGRSGWLARRSHAVLGDGRKLWTAQRPNEVLPYLEWGINYRVIARRQEFLQLHAATLARNGAGLILAADSGSGKSTLTAAMLARGWQYLSDEFALIEPATCVLHPFPKALCIKAGSFDLMRRLNLPLWRNRHYVKAIKGTVGYIRPHDIRPDVVSVPVPVRHVIFPQYIEGARPVLRPVPRAQAAFLLAGCAFNRGRFDQQAIPVIKSLVRDAECYRLEIGRPDETCDLLETMTCGSSVSAT
jgi:HprK-related kinase A